MFYANLIDLYSSFEILAKEVKIVLTLNILGSILKIPCNGIQLIVHNTWPKTPSSLMVLFDIDHINFPFTSNLLNLKMYVLHLMIAHILFLRFGSHTSFSIFDALMMFDIKHQVHLNLFSMMLTHMSLSSSHDTKTILPHQMYLVKVFHYFGVDLSNKTSSKLYFTQHYKHDSYLYMSCSFDHT